MYKYTNRQTEIHRQTDRQADSAKVKVKADKQIDVHKDEYSHILYST